MVELHKSIAQRLHELMLPSFSRDICTVILLNRMKGTSWDSLEVTPSKQNRIGTTSKTVNHSDSHQNSTQAFFTEASFGLAEKVARQ